jgi:hypothetical protein
MTKVYELPNEQLKKYAYLLYRKTFKKRMDREIDLESWVKPHANDILTTIMQVPSLVKQNKYLSVFDFVMQLPEKKMQSWFGKMLEEALQSGIEHNERNNGTEQKEEKKEIEQKEEKKEIEQNRFTLYRNSRADDAEWKAYNLARSYIARLNNAGENPKNTIRKPKPETLEKHGVYLHHGRYHSTTVDAYCQNHNCFRD